MVEMRLSVVLAVLLACAPFITSLLSFSCHGQKLAYVRFASTIFAHVDYFSVEHALNVSLATPRLLMLLKGN